MRVDTPTAMLPPSAPADSSVGLTVKAHGAAGILVTHSDAAAATCDRRYRLTAGGLAPLP